MVRNTMMEDVTQMKVDIEKLIELVKEDKAIF
jgi:hypothetical protein